MVKVADLVGEVLMVVVPPGADVDLVVTEPPVATAG